VLPTIEEQKQIELKQVESMGKLHETIPGIPKSGKYWK